MNTNSGQNFNNRKKLPTLPPQLKALLWRYRIPLAIFATLLLVSAIALGIVYRRFASEVEARLGSGSLRTSSTLLASPRMIGPGDAMTPAEVVVRLQRAGYTEHSDNRTGRYSVSGSSVEIIGGPESYFKPHHVRITFQNGAVQSIYSMRQKGEVGSYLLEPELITNVLDAGRGKRIFVPFSEFPKSLVNAVVSVEDKRFFQHSGLDLLRVAKAAYVDIREGRKEQGASTLTMQLARSFWLDQDKNWKRKMSEVMLAAELERRFTKEEVFQLYANEVYLGRRGSFSVHGFGEAARAFFGKDVRKLTLPEAAMLAGMIQRPSYYNPLRSPDRVKERRDLVLTMMPNNGYIDASQLQEAKNSPVRVTPGEIESTDAPYFVDMVNTELQGKFDDWDFDRKAYRIYTTLDMDLQKAALDAVAAALPGVKRRAGKHGKGAAPQIALVALDAHTGAIKALVGGRNYAESQLNRVFAKRQPGSAFKPFVYAAALNATATGRTRETFTAASHFIDQPTTFLFNNKPYQPANFEDKYLGSVTIRKAVMHSLNIPTVKVAEKLGYTPLVEVARAAGIKAPLDATPSLALGSYEIPPIELAEAYTIFSNGGVHTARNWIAAIRDRSNTDVYKPQTPTNRVLDERVAYIMTNIMEDVVTRGTAGSIRSRGFKLPAAGKTGTARDGWFAGYTSELLTVVWVGYDDYSDLDLEGSKSALPVWTEFMKRAHSLRQYSGAKPFKAPQGVVKADVDAETGLLPGEFCTNIRTELFVTGTQPKTRCSGEHWNDYMDPTAETVSYQGGRSVIGRVLDVFR
ncbi:MAG TPA: PBP1A family penicillin-binding protein [Bryobacteraceae bacterium]|nr:PBP1A family penicillin-binding protein [Bryobacteraceae bacterium]